MRLFVIIVNYRTASLTLDCLRSLATEIVPQEDGDWQVVVTDNLSSDGSVEALIESVRTNGWESWCKMRPLHRNGGFAFGNNQAFPPARELPPYVLLLNPDTIIRPGAISVLLEFADANPRAGIVGSRLEEADGTPQNSAFNFPGILSELESKSRLGIISRLLRPWMIAPPVKEQPHRCDWVAGACMLIRREVIQQIGQLDEKYFMYFEEVDFCLRAARAGWECWYVPNAHVVHLVGQASGVTDTKRPPRRLPAYWFESRQRYFRKNHGSAYALLADAAWLTGFLFHRAVNLLRGRSNNDPPLLLRDFLSHAIHRNSSQ